MAVPKEMIDDMATAAAEEAIKQFDKNNDGVIDRSEAEPMLKEVFEGLKTEGKIPDSVCWNADTFEEGFKEVDKDNSGKLDVSEITAFVKKIFTMLIPSDAQ